jgi:DNA-binding CsgD family transcriptional regulator
MSRLTAREKQVVALLAQGRTPREIAAVLCVSRATIYTHIDHTRIKTATATTFELAVKAATNHTD